MCRFAFFPSLLMLRAIFIWQWDDDDASPTVNDHRIIRIQETAPLSSVKNRVCSQTQAHSHRHSSALFDHEHHQCQPSNVNLVHKAEQKAVGINKRIAVGLTKRVGTKWTAYAFAGLEVVGLMAIVALLSPIVALLFV